MHRTILACAAVGLWAVAGAPLLLAQDAAADGEAEASTIARLVEDLGSADFRVREAASKALAEQGEAARAALEAATKSADPAIRFRAEQLLDRLDGGPRERPLTPDDGEARDEPSPRGGRLGPDGRWRDDDFERQMRRMKEEMDRQMKELEESVRSGRFGGLVPWGDLWPDRDGKLPRLPHALGEARRIAPDLRVKVDGGDVWAELIEGPRGARIVITEKAEPENVTTWSGPSVERILASRPQIRDWPGAKELLAKYEEEKKARDEARARAGQRADGFPRLPGQARSLSIVAGPDGVRVTVTEQGPDGAPVTKTYEGKSLEEIRREHPELGDTLGGFSFRADSSPRRPPLPPAGERPLGPLEPGEEPALPLPPTGEAPIATGPFGLALSEVDPSLRAHLGLPPGAGAAKGALVLAVRPSSEAAQLGLEVDDVIVSVNGAPVLGLDDVGAKLRALAPGAALAVEVVRHGKPLTLARPAK